MKYLIQKGVILLLVFLICTEGVPNDRKFLFTCSKTFFSGKQEKVCIFFRNVTEPVNVQVSVLEEKGHTEIAAANEQIDAQDNDGKCFDVSIPRTKSKKGRLALSISFPAEDYSINYYEQISIHPSPDVLYVLTDKPIYSGGHVIKFRIFIIGSDLRPVEENVEKIWIENPNGVHLNQWLNESTSNGFIEKSFQLSNEPLTGVWNIKVKRQFDDITSQGFKVENYVLPRFTVTLDIPKSVNTSTTFNITVCAKYMFGEPVHGTVNLHLYIKCSFSFYCRGNRTYSKEYLMLDKNGCTSHQYQLSNVSDFAQKIIVNATVREAGTGIRAGSTAGIEIVVPTLGTNLEFSRITKEKHFKPGLPFKGQIVQKSPSPINSAVLLCSVVNDQKKCSQIRLEKGVANFVLPPTIISMEKNFSIYLEMSEVNNFGESVNEHITKLSLVPWYSPTGSYLQLEDLSNKTLKCNSSAIVNVVFSKPDIFDMPRFFYLIKARGNIIEDGILNPEPTSFSGEGFRMIGAGNFDHVKQFQFSFQVTSDFSPHSYLIVYYIGSDGEVVADTLTLQVEKCLKNPVYMEWHKNMSLPGDINKLKIKSYPHSVCGLSVKDRSTKFLSKSTAFNKDTIFKSFKKFDVESRNSDARGKRCKNSTDTAPADEVNSYLSFPETDSAFVDSQQAFEDFGAIVISNLILETRPCKNDWMVEKSMRNATARQLDVRTYGNEPENMIQPKRSDLIKFLSKQRELSIGFELRNFFPETWIWEVVTLSESGTAEINAVAPHTITEWDSEVVCLSKEGGLGIADVERMTTYQPFFLDFSVPHSIKRKEIFYLSVSVFNYEDQHLPIRITCTPSNRFISKKENARSDCIKSKSKIVQKFALEPILLGEAVITVMAEIDTNYDGKCGNFTRYMRDTVSKRVLVKHEGFPAEDVKSGFICADNKNFENEVSWNMRIPADIVESSVSVDGLVCGDILGPTLKNIDQLLTLPTGCGEQNMILLAPNILILEYLLLTKSEDSELIEKALKNLDLGYQKQLNYKHSDGSYSAFGEKDERGSIWLTAFVVRYLSQAQKFIHIDKNDLNISVNWILRHQLENGCFPVIGKIYHRDLKGKFSENESSKALTAYLIISLIESGLVSKDTSSIKNAVYCLKGIEQSSGIYGDLLATYALLMVGEVRDAQALMFDMLKSSNRVYGLLWWESDQNSSAESSVEMTAYGILCLLKLGGSYFTAAASDGVKWITQYRNRNGGFISSQDTILALEAISKLSASLPRMSNSDKLIISLETMNNNISFEVDKNNVLLQQKHSLPTYLTDVKFSAAGKGCALVQTHMRYNTRHGRQSNQLKIQLKIDSVSDIDLYFITKFNICVRHKHPTETVKMAVLEVFMVSGFYPDRFSLYEIPVSSKSVKKWEEYEEKVVFYFEDLKQRKMCVQFLVNQEVCVEKTNPALIKLYDYYNNQQITTVKYNLQPECNNTGNWLNALPEQKSESYKDVLSNYHSDEGYHNSNISGVHLEEFTDVNFDLETPEEIGPLPVYVPSPASETSEFNCPNCLDRVPSVFPNLYCSAERVIIVKNGDGHLLNVVFDVSPRRNVKAIERAVSFDINKNCVCKPLEKVNGTFIIIITPAQSSKMNTLPKLKLGNETLIIPLEYFEKELPGFLTDAISYCQTWSNMRNI